MGNPDPRVIRISAALSLLSATVVWLAGGSNGLGYAISLFVVWPLAYFGLRTFRRRRDVANGSTPSREALRHSETVGDYVWTDVGVWTKDGFVPEKKYVPALRDMRARAFMFWWPWF